MAEVAAGALVAEQIVATSVEVAAVAAIAAPTQPLKVSLTQLANVTDESFSCRNQELGRSHHTLTVIGDKAYIFGGEDPRSRGLCSPNVHVITLPTRDPKVPADVKHLSYEPFPVLDEKTGETYIPAPRTKHAACARGKYLIIHGGQDHLGHPIEEDNCLWLWDTEALRWSRLRGDTQIGKIMAARYDHHIFVDPSQDFLILHGGQSKLHSKPDASTAGISVSLTLPHIDTTAETWHYDFNSHAWTALPSCPSPSTTAAYVASSSTLYTIARTALAPGSPALSGTIHSIALHSSPTEREKPSALTWQTHEFPINPLTPGPSPREGAALVPLTAGHGRTYLLYMFGSSPAPIPDPKTRAPSTPQHEPVYYSDVWALQLPSGKHSAAAAKDVICEKLPGMQGPGTLQWAEAEIVPTEKMLQTGGKVHPGPRVLFSGYDACFGGEAVVFWGGMNAKHETEADGWVVALADGYADNDRYE
ncbi:hypothetical protein B0H67DRAFT_108134 [Lasiosphaeris hirsuta]|uniref:Kelch domain-containing protein n=1 Tax=Lasiosphaeris hirsuta TaxID=260670 RepID=A0AA40AYW1_9PEZI|nr:hypothetical protein B0H67DRAFT_108134 [Lasiosphaeris hirsuta]